MVRPKKNTVDYFPHYVNSSSGETLSILQDNFGNDGYAFWFKMLELLGSTKNHLYKCDTSAKMKFLASRTKVDEESAKEILNLLAELEAIDKELWENHQIIWVQNLVNNLVVVYDKRTAELPQKPDFSIENSLETEVSDTETTDNESFLPGNPA